VQQYELFRMEDGETISSMQMRLTHIVNKFQNLGKTISNQDCTNKIEVYDKGMAAQVYRY
jgi:hypothetical protein